MEPKLGLPAPPFGTPNCGVFVAWNASAQNLARQGRRLPDGYRVQVCIVNMALEEGGRRRKKEATGPRIESLRITSIWRNKF